MQRKRTRKGLHGHPRTKVSKRGDGRYRVQCIWPDGSAQSASKVLSIKVASWATKREANEIAKRATEKMYERGVTASEVTVRELSERWCAFKRKQRDKTKGWEKESTARVNERRIARFVQEHGHLSLQVVEEEHVHAFQPQNHELMALCPMFHWATTAKGGRLLDRSPCAEFEIEAGDGNAKKNPPTEQEIRRMIALGEQLLPTFGAWLRFACFTGLRPGEIDALKWEDVVPMVVSGHRVIRVNVRRHYSRTSNAFTLPKNGTERWIYVPVEGDAAQALALAKRFSDGKTFVFTNTLDNHWTADSRAHYWRRVYESMRWAKGQYTPYLATRHFAGSYMTNVLAMPSERVAFQLGHCDGGTLVRRLYGHPDENANLLAVALGYASAPKLVALEAVS